MPAAGAEPPQGPSSPISVPSPLPNDVTPQEPAPPADNPAVDERLFAPDSVWNASLSNSAPLDPSSVARMAAFDAEIQNEITVGIGPWIDEVRYSTPLYRVAPDQPRVPVKLDTGAWGAPLQAALAQGVPIPDDAQPAAGTDGQLTIYQPSSDTLWELYQASRMADGWHATWGGVMQQASKSPGYYTGSSWPGLTGIQGWNWGSTATSLPVIGGTIMIDELQRGHIDHALAMNIPNPCAGVFSWPAQRSDGSMTADDCLPEGAHLRLDPALDLSTLNLPPITRMLAEAAQRYGIIVRDKTGHATGFYAEDPSPTGSNPYIGPDGLFDGLPPWKFLPKFPWGHLELLRMTLCSRAPCLPSE